MHKMPSERDGNFAIWSALESLNKRIGDRLLDAFESRTETVDVDGCQLG